MFHPHAPDQDDDDIDDELDERSATSGRPRSWWASFRGVDRALYDERRDP
jgi:hypothetical protein